MKRKLVKLSLFLGLLGYVNYSAEAAMVSNMNSAFAYTFDWLLGRIDATESTTETERNQEQEIVKDIETNTLFEEIDNSRGEVHDIFVEPVEPVYVNETEVPMTPNEVVSVVNEMNDEMTEIEAQIKEREEREAALPVFTDFRQTFYAVTDGEVKVGYGLTYHDEAIQNIDNIMHYNDDHYSWLPVVAVNIDEVLAEGLNKRGVPNYYGTVLEIEYPNGVCQNAIVLDACGACSWDERIDLWLYNPDYELDVEGIKYKVIRDGFDGEAL